MNPRSVRTGMAAAAAASDRHLGHMGRVRLTADRLVWHTHRNICDLGASHRGSGCGCGPRRCTWQEAHSTHYGFVDLVNEDREDDARHMRRWERERRASDLAAQAQDARLPYRL